MITSKNTLILALCAGVIIASSSYLLLTAAGDGTLAIAEPDAVLYLQYAKNIAIGNPYVFSPGDAPSTGSTTHLYPFLLAVLYRLGATGDAFTTATFVLNSLFYLGIITLTWFIAKRLAPRIVPLAVFMTVFCGHTVSATLRLTDIGFFSVLALATFASLLYRKHVLTFLLVVLCSITRPEGFVFSIALLLCGLFALLLSRKPDEAPETRKDGIAFLCCGLAGIAAFLLTLVINYKLTGYFQFMSVANKGYFKICPLTGAIQNTLYDFLSIIKGVLFGLPESKRQFYLLPVISGALGIAGILLHPRADKKTGRYECWLAISAGAALLLIASSQWQGVSNDRYLAWLMPVWIIYISIGVHELSDRLKAKSFLPICVFLLIAYQAATLGFMASDAYSVAVNLEKKEAFGAEICAQYPNTTRFGDTSGGGMNYFVPDHKIYNVYGITSPAFFETGSDQKLHRVMDLLKHQPELRFDYWITTENFTNANPWATVFIGELTMKNTDTALMSEFSDGVYAAKWETLEGGLVPQLCNEQLDGMALIDSLDIAYLSDEKAHHYTTTLRLKNTTLTTVIKTDQLGSRNYSEAGRLVMGSESFVARNVETGKPLLLVLRTGKSAEGEIYFGRQHSKINKLVLNDQIALRLFVDDLEVPCPPVDISAKGFSEVVVEIPAVYLNNSTPRIAVIGDHISYAYWFYQ